jgi:copper chaperone CopZ
MKKDFEIEGMSCHHCVMAVEKYLSTLNLIKYKVTIGSARVEFDEDKTKEEIIVKTIKEVGYKVVN